MSKCTTCNQLLSTTPHSELCNNCWEFERRLPIYLASVGGRAKVLQALDAVGAGVRDPYSVATSLVELEASITEQMGTTKSIPESGGLKLMAGGVRWARQHLVCYGADDALVWRQHEKVKP